MHRLTTGLERPILPSARKGFPTPASDTPSLGSYQLGSCSWYHHVRTRPFSLANPKAIKPSRKQKLPYQAKMIPAKGRQHCALGKPCNATSPSPLQGCHLVCRKGPVAGCPHLWNSTSHPAASSRLSCPPLLPSRSCHFWVPRKESDESSRS